MPAPLLGPNLGGSSTTHPQPNTQTYISGDTNPITPGMPVIFSNTGIGTNVVGGNVQPANTSIAGIALRNATKGQYVQVAIDGPVKCKTSGSPASGAQLQIDATGNALTTLSSGKAVGYALEASVNNVATVLLRLN